MKYGNYKVIYRKEANSQITFAYCRASSVKEALDIALTWPGYPDILGILSPEAQDYHP